MIQNNEGLYDRVCISVTQQSCVLLHIVHVHIYLNYLTFESYDVMVLVDFGLPAAYNRKK